MGRLLLRGEEGCPSRSLWEEVWFFWAGGGDGAWEGDLSYGEGWRGGAGRAGRGSYGHWLVRVPPELVLEVGAVRVPPLPMEGVGLLRVPPDPTWEVWLTAQQA